MSQIDYYAVLSVSPDAEATVIRAAYKALAQKYHPDKFAGSQAEAQKRMTEINQAYAVLSDSQKRQAYDQERRAQSTHQETRSNPQDSEWRIACDYHSHLSGLARDLARLDPELETDFRNALLKNKAFAQADQLAKKLEEDYLSGFFGEDASLRAFAKAAILQGRRDVANEINQTLRTLGDTISASQLIEKMEAKYFPERIAQRKAEKEQKEQAEREARAWYRKAADQGQAEAQNNLGVMYENGKGVAQDDKEAVKWYRKAAIQGHADAQNMLSAMFYTW